LYKNCRRNNPKKEQNMKRFTPNASCQNRSAVTLNLSQNCIAKQTGHEKNLSLSSETMRFRVGARNDRRKDNKKAAFTLAEVLITLAIVGVVAAITIPTLVQKNKERVTVTKVKATYSKLSQALRFAIAENGEVNGWDFALEGNIVSANSFFEYLRPYLKIAQDCGSNRTNICSISTLYQLNDISLHSYPGSGYYEFILNDGVKVWFRVNVSTNSQAACTDGDDSTKNVCALFWIDTDGANTKNVLGKDVFVFYIMKDGIIPHQSTSCGLEKSGWGCAKYILSNGNMNYLHK
jgi:prepilin-type N-terminal cleavage/methylation domain-containing protein